MPVNEEMNERVRRILGDGDDVTEKRMFGGTCFLVDGNMLCAVDRDRMFFRVGKDEDAAALKRPGAYPVEMRGRALKGFVWVDRPHLDARSLKRWLELARRYVSTLPKKPVKRGRAPVR
jgi:TfoX/Sxy family transcriptional regulator of competence genes